jgi:hypothetical protein
LARRAVKGVSSQVLFSAPVDTRITDYSVQLVHRYSVTGSANPAGGVYRNNSTLKMAVFGAYAFSLTGEYDPGVIGYVTGPPNHYWGGGGPVTQTVTLSKSDGPPAMLSISPRRARSRCMPAAGAALPMCAGWQPAASRSWT